MGLSAKRTSSTKADHGGAPPGCSAKGVEILKEAGVDLTKPDAVDAAARLMDETITEMEALADKLGAAGPKSPVIFECVGVPGMIDGAVLDAMPPHVVFINIARGPVVNEAEMIDRLTLYYNRSRQAAITKELIEIISGAEAAG